jgi:coenzyme F420-reducing hydrogenase delta subunit
MEYMGLEPGRIHFSWISSAEATKFVEVVNEVTSAIKALGPRKDFVKTPLITTGDKVTENVSVY